MAKRSSRDVKAGMDDLMGHVVSVVVVAAIIAGFYFMLQSAKERTGTDDAVIPTEKRNVPGPPM